MPTDYADESAAPGFNASAPPPLYSAQHSGGPVELRRVLPATPDINYHDHFTKDLLMPKTTTACPLSACGQPVEESQLVHHTLRCRATTALRH